MSLATSDIAVVGIACRFPQASNYREYWQMLSSGTSCVVGKSPARPDYRSNTLEGLSESTLGKGGYLHDIDKFDAAFFGISSVEAEAMDPQQRILLELSWHCLEDAGIVPDGLRGKNVGVFVGAFNADYKTLADERISDSPPPPHYSTGTAQSLLANRISYFYDLKGPSIVIDAACSASLYSLHLAVNSLRMGECSMAIAGAVNLILTESRGASFNAMGMLSPTGECRSFDSSADGYVRSEGAALLLLMPLQEAVNANHDIWGVIKGTAINHVGRGHTITYPDAESQASVIQKALYDSGIAPEQISAIEAHGTGTPKGDPIEMEGLQKVFEVNQSEDIQHPLYIGSAKSVIGHAEAAAGMAGVIKVLLSMAYNELPRLANFVSLNERISLENTRLKIVDQNKKWNRSGDGAPRYAGVSSFGFGGTNSHVILSDFVAIDSVAAPTTTGQSVPVFLSGTTPDMLKLQVLAWLDFSERYQKNNKLIDISIASLLKRKHFNHRLVFYVTTNSEFVELLKRCVSENSWSIDGISYADVSECAVAKIHSASLANEHEYSLASKELSAEDLEAYLHELAESYLTEKLINPTYIDRKNLAAHVPLANYAFDKASFWLTEIQYLNSNVQKNSEGNSRVEAELEEVVFAPVWRQFQVQHCAPGTVGKFPVDAIVCGASQDQVAALEAKYNSVRKLTFEQLLVAETLESVAVYWLFIPSNSVDASIEQSHHIKLLFEFISTALKSGLDKNHLQWNIVTRDAVSITSVEEVNPEHSAIYGLLRVVERETPLWKVSVVDVDSTQYSIDELLVGIAGIEGRERLAIRDGEFYLQERMPVVRSTPRHTTAYREGGVYVIIGGAGHLGQILTEYLIDSYSAQVVWLGSREVTPDIHSQLESLGGNGTQPVYLQADVTNSLELIRARETIVSRYGAINGVFNAAMKISETPVAQMDIDDFLDVYRVKALGSHNIGTAFLSDELDFLCFFSSYICFEPSANLAHYASSCMYMDSLAEMFRKQMAAAGISVNIKTVNWGFWMSEQMQKFNLYKQAMGYGIQPIVPDKAMGFLDEFLASPLAAAAYLNKKSQVKIGNLSENNSVKVLPEARKGTLVRLFEKTNMVRVKDLNDKLQHDVIKEA